MTYADAEDATTHAHERLMATLDAPDVPRQ